jgi:hypothetical protein
MYLHYFLIFIQVCLTFYIKMKMKDCFLKLPVIESLTFILLSSLNCFAINVTPEVSIVTDKSPGISFLHGLTKLTNSLQAKNITFEKAVSLSEAKGKLIIVAGLSAGDGEAAKIMKAGNHIIPEVSEALTTWKTKWQNKIIWVIGGFDDKGLMYGLLDVAIRIGWSEDSKNPMSEVKEITEKPDVKERAVSIYTMNRTYWESRLYDEAYWIRYLDMLAQNRFNSMVVIFGYENGGFMAPCYPYFFNVEGFPDIRMVGLTPEQQQKNLSAFKKLIKMANDRGIRFTAGIKDHIYRGGVQGGGIPGIKNAPDQPVPGLVWGINNDNLISYTKAALTKFIKLFPDLDGILFFINDETGLKKGELLGFATDFFQMIKEITPRLNLYIHSKGLTDPMIQSAVDVNVNFLISPKYWMEQMGLPYHPTHINRENQFDRRHGYSNLLIYPQNYKLQWRLWNGGTTRILLWGDPEYARRFAGSTHLYDGNGFDVNEPLATKMEAQPHDAIPFDLIKPQYRYYDYEFERYWHFFQVFGRMGYNPETSPDVWKKEFELRFGKKAAPLVESALHKASWILPRIVASCYPYACFPTTRGWPEKQRLGDLPDYAMAEGSDIQQFASFDEEAKILIEAGETAKILPSVNSLWFDQTSSDIKKLIYEAEKAIAKNRNKEFNSTITDLNILANLALYHSRRIPAAVCYRLFERTHDISALDDAIAYERIAIEAWQQIVAAAGEVYADDLMMGVREAEFMKIIHRLSGHWKDELGYLEKGLTALEQKRGEFKAEGIVKPAPHFKAASSVNYNPRFQIIHKPVTIAPIDKPITVSVKVIAPAGVKWVRLRYRNVNQEQDYKTLQMVSTGEKDSYQAIISSEQIKTKWDFMYFIEVMDNKGNGRIYPDLNIETPYIIVKLIR